MEDIRDIPQFAIDKKNEMSETKLDATNFPLKLYPYDAFQEGTSNGYSSKEEFISTVLSSETAPIYEVSLRPSVSVETSNFSVDARWIKNIINYNQKEDDVASLIYSQERPVYQTNKELDLRDRLIFWTQESIYGDGLNSVKISKDTPVFEIDSYDPQYDENGVFQYATLILKRVVSWKARRTRRDGSGAYEYVEFDFFRADIQPKNAIRRRRTWKSKPIQWFTDIRDGGNTTLDWKSTPATKGEPFITPWLPRKVGGTQLNFAPSWINEIGYWNTNYKLITQRANGFNISTEENSLRTDADGGFSGTDTPVINAIPLWEYEQSKLFITLPIINQPDKVRKGLYEISAETLDFSTPFNFMGYKWNGNFENASSQTLPRPGVSDGTWKIYEDESYWLVDFTSNIFNVPFAATNGFLDISKPKNNDNNTKYKEISLDILKGNATMFGQTINLRPPSSYNGDFDFSSNPKDWSLEDMKKYTGVFYMGNDIGVDGSNNELELAKIQNSELPIVSTTVFTINSALGKRTNYNFGSSQNIKARLCGRNWYKNYNENWVDEKEWDAPAEVIIRDEEKYFGGYEYTDEWFSNTYEDSLINGDVYCKFEFDGIEYNLPPLTYRASNRRGNPLSYGETRIWGTGGNREIENTLINASKKGVENNDKKIMNYKTGKYVKNMSYNKGNKNGK